MPRSPSKSGSVSPPRHRLLNRSPVQASPARSPPPVQDDREPRLFVSGLSLEATQEDVRNLFSTHGQIVDFFMKKNQRGGIAFITFGTIEEADKAKECHGAQLNEKSIRVDFAKPRSANNDRGNNRQRPPRENAEFNRGERTKVCHKCQKEGHFARQCPEAANNEGNSYQRGNRPKTCFKCQKQGHFSRECPEANNQNQAGQRKPKMCFKCQKQGHFSRQCPENGNQNQKQQRKPKICFKCQKEGHFSKQCTQFAKKNNDEGLNQRRNFQEIRPFRRREVSDNRQTYSRRVITQPQEIFPPGRQDYVYQEPNTEDLTSSLGNRFPERNTMRGMSVEEPEQKRSFGRKRSISRSESPLKKHNNVNQFVTPKRNQRKKSVSHSASPIRNRVQKDDQAENVKKGLAESRQANASRSRSRQKAKVMQRKRSASKDSCSY